MRPNPRMVQWQYPSQNLEFLTNLLVKTFGLYPILTTFENVIYQALKLTNSDCQLQVEHVKISDHSAPDDTKNIEYQYIIKGIDRSRL